MTESRRQELHRAMVRFSDGDRGAFRAVFDGLWPVLLAFTRGMRLGPADAEDAAARALLLVFSRIADLDPERDGVAWALTLASYEVLTFRKQQTRRREAPVMALADTHDTRPGPEEATIAEDLRRCLREAVGELHEADRVALEALLADAELDPSERGRNGGIARASASGPGGGGFMVDLEALERRARRAAERGRWWMAARVGLVILPITCVSLLGGADPGSCLCLGAVLLGATTMLRVWHRDGVRAVRLGLSMGVVPLVAVLLLQACGAECAPLTRWTEAEVACVLAGVFAGAGVAFRAGREGYPVRTWALATAVASGTAALGCIGLGTGGLLVIVAALASTSTVAWVPMRTRSA